MTHHHGWGPLTLHYTVSEGVIPCTSWRTVRLQMWLLRQPRTAPQDPVGPPCRFDEKPTTSGLGEAAGAFSRGVQREAAEKQARFACASHPSPYHQDICGYLHAHVQDKPQGHPSTA